jgi:hypothetical protein
MGACHSKAVEIRMGPVLAGGAATVASVAGEAAAGDAVVAAMAAVPERVSLAASPGIGSDAIAAAEAAEGDPENRFTANTMTTVASTTAPACIRLRRLLLPGGLVR